MGYRMVGVAPLGVPKGPRDLRLLEFCGSATSSRSYRRHHPPDVRDNIFLYKHADMQGFHIRDDAGFWPEKKPNGPAPASDAVKIAESRGINVAVCVGGRCMQASSAIPVRNTCRHHHPYASP